MRQLRRTRGSAGTAETTRGGSTTRVGWQPGFVMPLHDGPTQRRRWDIVPATDHTAGCMQYRCALHFPRRQTDWTSGAADLDNLGRISLHGGHPFVRSLRVNGIKFNVRYHFSHAANMASSNSFREDPRPASMPTWSRGLLCRIVREPMGRGAGCWGGSRMAKHGDQTRWMTDDCYLRTDHYASYTLPYGSS